MLSLLHRSVTISPSVTGNGIPDQYEIDLVKVPGGEKVDKRIYEPLMEMLEDAKEENWNQL